MSSRAVQFLLVFSVVLLSNVAVGKLNHARSKMNHGDPYKNQLIELQNDGGGFALKRRLGKDRNKRAATGPVASSPYILQNDHHRYANVRYSGDESDVSIPFT